MKKKVLFVSAIVCLLALLFVIPAAAESEAEYVNAYPRVYDELDLLTDSEEAKLSGKLESLSEKYGFDFVVHTVYNLGDNDQMRGDNAEKWYDAHGFKLNGFMCTYEKKSNYKFFTCSGKCDDMISYDNSEAILDVICPAADSKDYYSYFNKFLDEIPAYIDYYNENGEPYRYVPQYKDKVVTYLFISVIIALIVAGVKKSSEKGKLKTVAMNKYAGNYIVDGSLNITGGADLFLYSTVTRTRRESSSSSSSHSSSHTSSSHSSSHGRH